MRHIGMLQFMILATANGCGISPRSGILGFPLYLLIIFTQLPRTGRIMYRCASWGEIEGIVAISKAYNSR